MSIPYVDTGSYAKERSWKIFTNEFVEKAISKIIYQYLSPSS